MAERVMLPEQVFLRDVFPYKVSETRLAVPFSQGADRILGQLRQHIAAALARLSYRERGILEMRYGLGDGFAYSLAEVGEVFKLTRERIRQLQARALGKLRKNSENLRNFATDLDVW